MVRRIGGGLGDMPRVFSNRASSRLSVRGRDDSPSLAASSGVTAYSPVSGQPAVVADWTGNILADTCERRSGLAHSGTANIFHWAAFRPAERHRPFGANVVRAAFSGAISVSPFCAFERCFPVCAFELAVVHRAASFVTWASGALVCWLPAVYLLLFGLGMAEPAEQRGSDGDEGRGTTGQRRRASAQNETALASFVRLRLDDASCGDESSFGKCGTDTPLVGRSARALFAFVCAGVCQAPVLFALVRGTAAGSRVGRSWLCDLRFLNHPRHSNQRAAFLLRALCGLFFLSRRTRSAKTCRALPDLFLPNHRARRRSRRGLCRLARSPYSFWNLRVADRLTAYSDSCVHRS